MGKSSRKNCHRSQHHRPPPILAIGVGPASASPCRPKQNASRRRRFGQRAHKPSSVGLPHRWRKAGIHSSRTGVATGLERRNPEARAGPLKRFPIPACTGWGLPCGPRCRRPGELLPHAFHPHRAAEAARQFAFCGTFLGVTPTRRYLAPCPVELGLSSRGAEAPPANPRTALTRLI